MKRGRDKTPHIGVFGRCNVGKSSFINTLTNQEVSIVSNVKGTTTDKVKRSFEILDFSPIILIDTAGLDDTTDIGKLRVAKSLEAVNEIDLAIIVISENRFDDLEMSLIRELEKAKVKFFVVANKEDFQPLLESAFNKIKTYDPKINIIKASLLKDDLKTEEKISDIARASTVETLREEVIDIIKKLLPENSYKTKSLLGDIIKEGDYIVLVCPIDSEAPTGRLILPQQQSIRDILDNRAISITIQPSELSLVISDLGDKLKLVITDSQMFKEVDKIVPKSIMLTSFSILLARAKGDFAEYLKGTLQISNLKDGDRVLILENCSHQVSCEDIGRVKIPKWLSAYSKCKLEYEVAPRLDPPKEKLDKYALVIQCGGCMVTNKQLENRLRPFINQKISVSNYGMTISFVNGILERSIEPFISKKVDASNSPN